MQQAGGRRRSRLTRRRQAHGRQRDRGHRHRHLHGHDPDRRRVPRAAARSEVTFELGDSTLPEAPVEGGLVDDGRSVGSAVKARLRGGRGRLLSSSPTRSTARRSQRPALDDVEFADGRMRLRDDPSRSVAIAEAMRRRRGRRHRGARLEAAPKEHEKYSRARAFGALRRGGGRRGLRHGPRHAGRERDRRRAGSSTPRPPAARSSAASSGASAWRCRRRASSTTASAGS